MMRCIKTAIIPGLVFFALLISTQVKARTVEYDLVIAERDVNITGKSVPGMTINGTIPGPALRFREGDFARIRVRNDMSVATTVHWHGLLVPPAMDGVPYVSFPPIEPGTTFTYEFPIRQSGTYWYHSHTGLQEQKGVYGAIVIEGRQNKSMAKSDHVILFSDWIDEDTHEVVRTLKRGSEWYSIEKGTAQSIIGAARVGRLGAYFRRELMRMPAMDVADIAYDRFLANGKPEVTLSTQPGEKLRLRIVNGSAGTNFLLEYAGGPMTIVASDGQEVRPLKMKRLYIAIAETYDVFIEAPASSEAYEFRATAQDGSGHASVWVGAGDRRPAPDVPKPDLYHGMGSPSLSRILALTPAGAAGMPDRKVRAGEFDTPGMMDMDMGSMAEMSKMSDGSGPSQMPMSMISDRSKKGHALGEGDTSMAGPAEQAEGMGPMQEKGSPSQASRSGKKFGGDFRLLAADVSSSADRAVDGMGPRRPWPPYERLCSEKPASPPDERPVREIRLTLDGDMERYVWFINNKPLSESNMIPVKKGERVRFILINRTMMHHPMHLHGHFFRVLNAQGKCTQLKHTVDVAPMSTSVIEFEATETGDWFFHCHLLYHLKTGMARVVHYEGFKISPQLEKIRFNLKKDSWYFWGRADVLSNATEGFLLYSNTRNILSAEWEVGWQDVDSTEWEGIFFYDRYINRFFTLFTGIDTLGIGDTFEDTRGVFGLRYLLPLNLETRTWVDTDGGVRVNIGKSFVLTPRLILFGEAQYDTHDKWEQRVRLSYLINRSVSLVTQWHSDYGLGGGLQIRF